MLAAREAAHPRVKPQNIVFLGSAFKAAQIGVSVSDGGFLESHAVEEIQDERAYARVLAGHLYRGDVVGLFYGRMEFGPRALGHRSLLASATDRRVNESLNRRLHRTEFMPFAPVTLRQHASDAYIGWDEADMSRFDQFDYSARLPKKLGLASAANI